MSYLEGLELHHVSKLSSLDHNTHQLLVLVSSLGWAGYPYTEAMIQSEEQEEKILDWFSMFGQKFNLLDDTPPNYRVPNTKPEIGRLQSFSNHYGVFWSKYHKNMV